MQGPKQHAEHGERLLKCEEDLEVAYNLAVDAVVLQAVAAGWDASEAEEAILSLAQNRRWAALENESTAGALDEIWEEMGERSEH
jgi:hypothetical protein